ncbi:hypothetical protein Tco_0014834 [Tanacetum coccineum]
MLDSLIRTFYMRVHRIELALITFPPGNDDHPFDIEYDRREIEYLLNNDPTKEIDYILEDSVDEVDDDPVELESDNDDVYDDPFDSKEDKIKESKLLIDELDPPRSIDFLPSPKCDSVLYEDFSEVDALPSTNNEDKEFLSNNEVPPVSIAWIFEASRAHGFCPSFTRASHPQLHFGNPISKSYRLTCIL